MLHCCNSTFHHCDHATSSSNLSKWTRSQLNTKADSHGRWFPALGQLGLHQILVWICTSCPSHVLPHLLTPIVLITAAPTKNVWFTSKPLSTAHKLMRWGWCAGYTSQTYPIVLYVISPSCFFHPHAHHGSTHHSCYVNFNMPPGTTHSRQTLVVSPWCRILSMSL